MGRMLFGLAVASVFWIALICPPPFPASGGRIGVSTAWAAEEFSYRDDEILLLFSHEHNMEHYAHLNGMVTNLWKNQKRFYDVKGTGENTAADKVEDLINDSSLAASQDNYEEAFADLKSAFAVLKVSLTELGIKKEE